MKKKVCIILHLYHRNVSQSVHKCKMNVCLSKKMSYIIVYYYILCHGLWEYSILIGCRVSINP